MQLAVQKLCLTPQKLCQKCPNLPRHTKEVPVKRMFSAAMKCVLPAQNICFGSFDPGLIVLVHLFEVLLGEILLQGACELYPYHCLCLHGPDDTIGTRARSKDNSNLRGKWSLLDRNTLKLGTNETTQVSFFMKLIHGGKM